MELICFDFSNPKDIFFQNVHRFSVKSCFKNTLKALTNKAYWLIAGRAGYFVQLLSNFLGLCNFAKIKAKEKMILDQSGIFYLQYSVEQ